MQKGKAVQRGQRGNEYLKVVFCKDGDVAKARLVQTGISDETGVEILGGIDDNDSVVVGPYRSLDQLKDESPVRLETDVKGKTAAKKGS